MAISQFCRSPTNNCFKLDYLDSNTQNIASLFCKDASTYQCRRLNSRECYSANSFVCTSVSKEICIDKISRICRYIVDGQTCIDPLTHECVDLPNGFCRNIENNYCTDASKGKFCVGEINFNCEDINF
jgi:hypothetical protein